MTAKFKQEWNLWIDDMRDPVEILKPSFTEIFREFKVYERAEYVAADFIWAKSATDAIRLVKNFGPPKFAALDHDLGDHTVFEFLKWLEEHHHEHPPQYYCHSANLSGVQNVNAFMRSWHRVVKGE